MQHSAGRGGGWAGFHEHQCGLLSYVCTYRDWRGFLLGTQRSWITRRRDGDYAPHARRGGRRSGVWTDREWSGLHLCVNTSRGSLLLGLQPGGSARARSHKTVSAGADTRGWKPGVHVSERVERKQRFRTYVRHHHRACRVLLGGNGGRCSWCSNIRDLSRIRWRPTSRVCDITCARKWRSSVHVNLCWTSSHLRHSCIW